MKQEVATLLALFSPHPHITLMRLSAPGLAQAAQPGQYVMARVSPGWDPPLREPLFVAGVQREEQALTLWVPGGTPAREQLRALAPGGLLDLLGLFGQPLPRRPTLQNVLLVAEGLALGPLLPLAETAISARQQVALLAVVPEQSEPYPPEALPVELEYQRAPRGGASLAAAEMLRWADTVFAAGSQQFYRDLQQELRAVRPGQRGGFAFGLLLEPFGWQPPTWGAGRVACALTACRSCLVELRREKLLACSDGPMFDLWSL
jgi:NAD(P)H-flavin reductase